MKLYDKPPGLRYYPPEKQGLRPWLIRTQGRQMPLRYYPPEKQGLRRLQFLPLWRNVLPQILSSRKTRIKTNSARPWWQPERLSQILSSRKTRIKTARESRYSLYVAILRYYPPEKQGLRPDSVNHTRCNFVPQILSSRKTRIKTTARVTASPLNSLAQILSSRKTRIKTVEGYSIIMFSRSTQILSSRKTRIKTAICVPIRFTKCHLRYYPPEKQGLRLWKLYIFGREPFLRYYPPEKQGLRPFFRGFSVNLQNLRYYPPEKQGLRLRNLCDYQHRLLLSDTILQKNKD